MMDEDRITFYERQAEEAYGRMYDARSSSDTAARYSDAKEALHSAIALAAGAAADR
jgi:hypothetical protein